MSPSFPPLGPGPFLPRARGPHTELLFARLAGPPGVLAPAPPAVSGLMTDDEQLALYCCYELAYRGFAGVDERWEWEPSLIAYRRELERAFEDGLRSSVPAGPSRPSVASVVAALWAVAHHEGGPSLSGWLRDHADIGHVREMAIHRSAYQLKEADPHSWAIPRLGGEAKAALVTIQFDEYGSGQPGQSHAELFGVTMRALGLDEAYGHYLDRLPGSTLATVNLISLLGMHRRLRGALIGHLALFEMTSVGPMRRYSEAFERLGVPAAARRFYDVHVVADAEHEVIATERMVSGLLRAEPDLGADVLFGAHALTAVEGRFAAHLLQAWTAGRSSLLPAGRPHEVARAA